MSTAARDLIDPYDPFDLFDAEAARLDAYFSGLDESGWSRPSRCEGWSVRDVLAHLAGEELYNHACLDDDITGLVKRIDDEGIDGLSGFNDWCVRTRRELPFADVVAEWRERNGETRRRMRERGRDGSLPTMVGPYPAGLQTLHYASEYATHGDDVGVPVAASEADGRTAWRAAVGRFVLDEQGRPVEVTESANGFVVVLDDVSAELSAADFVEATVDRLPADHPLDRRLADALVCLA